MAYIKNNWVDQSVERPKTYEMTNNSDGSVTLIDSFGLVSELGTPVNADNMNHIEEGIAGCDLRKHNLTETYVKGEWVTGVVEDVKGIYESLTDNNYGNPLTDDTKWQKVELGGGGSGFNLFDLVIKDHVLSFEESKGYALQGTYVYKTGVSGSRYGYPDFYNKCVEEYNADENTLEVLKNNAGIVGNPVIANGVASGFTTTSYLTAPSFSNSNFKFQVKFRTSSNVSGGEQDIFSCRSDAGANLFFCLLAAVDNNIWIGFNGGAGVWPYGFSTPVSANTDYIVKAEYSANMLHVTISLGNGTILVDETKQADSLYSVMESNLGVGKDSGSVFQPFSGSIDLKECYIESNNERIWKGATVSKKNPNGHIFYDIADKATIDGIFANTSTAWFYGIDTANERVFLPRNNNFVQITGNTAKVNTFAEAGLPNITGTVQTQGYAGNENSGALSSVGAGWQQAYATGADARSTQKVVLNAANSNPIYGKSDTVQPAALKQLLYIVVGNTEAASSVTDVVDITTTENDTIPLFTGMYFDFAPNHPSWLKAGEHANNEGLYRSTYNTLVKCLTDNIYNLKVIEESAMVSGTDYSEYWKVDQTNMTFRTPTRKSGSILVEKKEATADDPSWYNLYSDGWCEQGGVASGSWQNITVSFSRVFLDTNYNVEICNIADRTPTSNDGSDSVRTKTVNGFVFTTGSGGITSAMWSVCGYTAIPELSEHTENNRLYFKVANALQNIQMLDVGAVTEAVGEVTEALANKVDVADTQWATGACVPDYTAGISYPFDSTIHKAPTNGVLIVGLGASRTTTGGVYVGYTEDNVNIELGFIKNSEQQGTWVICAFLFILPKDIYFRAKAIDTVYTFYPYKGAI